MLSYFSNDLTTMLGIKHPIILAGMNVASGAKLAAAVCNAGGLGVIGGMNYTPYMLRSLIRDLKSQLNDKDYPFGVDLLLPKIGEGARKTNYDYTKGNLDELIDIIIEEKAKLFVSAVGIPPKYIVDKLHMAGIYVMNMIGSPKHVHKALNVGVDMLCAQGGEGGGHTGDIGTMVLIPAIVDAASGYLSPLTQKQVHVIAAGGIYDGRTFIAALSLGASAVWIGTRFVASIESGAPEIHKNAILNTDHDNTMKTLVYTGRPLRIISNDYANTWINDRREKMEELILKGISPANYDLEILENIKNQSFENIDKNDLKYLAKYHGTVLSKPYPHLSGQVAGSINKIDSAADIIHNILVEAINIVNLLNTMKNVSFDDNVFSSKL